MLQIIAQFVLYSSAFSKWKRRSKKRDKKKKKEGKNGFPSGKLMAVPLPALALGLPWLLCAIKKYFNVWSLNFMCIFCVDSNLVG
jgi:hypothetical protein